MKEIIKNYTEKHPYLTYSLVVTGLSSLANMIVGISRSITGNYPDNQLVKVDHPTMTLGDTSDNDKSVEETDDEIDTTEVDPEPAEE